jgi:uncharacterized SAM-binding protein YcdF (DUF218 family)
MRARRAVYRGIAGFLGGLSLVNAVAGVADARLNANGWWVDLRPLPAPLAFTIHIAGAAALLAVALDVRLHGQWRTAVTGMVLVLAALVLRNVTQFYGLAWRGAIDPWLPVPLSLPLCAVLLWIAKMSAGTFSGRSPKNRRRENWAAAAVAGVAMALTPLLGILFFGTTDYRRPADVAVVFGARAYADGRPSDALADRVRTACDLYRQGLVKRLVFSGGPGDGVVHETESMRRLAIASGVPDGAILLDRKGLNTAATVRNTCPLARTLGATRVIAVSHAYHLPRVKMCYQRHGLEVYTVPATQQRTLRAMPLLVAREVAAAWAYYFRGS